MLVYQSTKSEFLHNVENDMIAISIRSKIQNKLGQSTSEAEFRSWENSLSHMYMVLNDEKIPSDSGIAIEYNIPQTSKRVDFIISGYNEYEKPEVVIIELKQWEKVKLIENRDGLIETFIGGSNRRVVHPSYQAWSYSSLIKDYNSMVQENDIHIEPCVYMHNYKRIENDDIDNKQYEMYYKEAPLFTKGDLVKLRNFIKNNIKKGDNGDILYIIDEGKIKPSKKLQDSISEMINDNKNFVMLDEQKVVFEDILALSKKSSIDNKKRTIIVKGGPGTGKSVIAINLLAKLTQMDQFVQYVSKNSAPREVYIKQLKNNKVQKNSVSIDNMFSSSGKYTNVDSNVINTVLVDESHRLNEKSGLFKNLGENQIKELIHVSKCSVFFIDEKQRVTISDIGSISEIEKWARHENSEVFYMELKSQFRCNGSNGYLEWLDNVLEIEDKEINDVYELDYDIKVYDNPEEIRDIIVEKNKNPYNTARVLAGYCWDWIKEGKNDSSIHDIVIDDFRMSWNLSNSKTYALDNSISEAGCIHTTQGLEFDYVGVIIGEDLRYENGAIVTDFTKRAKTDQSLKGIKKIHKNDPEKALRISSELIKNTYRTLLTRGMKGCYIYCVDKNLSEYLKSEIRRCKTY